MTYLKTLIALTTLALLTACAGGVAITNNTTIIPPAATCTANPFTTGCTTTLAEQATFCRDTSKTTTTKTADCADTVIRVCTGDVFDTICPTTPTQTEAEVFCRDATKTPSDKATNCTPTVMRVCGENPYDAGLCYVGNTFNGQRQRIELTCENANDAERHALCPMAVATECTTNPFNAVCRLGTAGAGEYNTARLMAIADCGDATKRDTIANEICAGATTQACGENPYNAGLCYDGTTYDSARGRIRLTCDKGDSGRDALCPTAVATECMADPFLDVCRLGTAGADTGTYGMERAAQILATCAGENGEGFGNVFDPKCSDVEPYQTEKDRITNECEGGGGNTETCPANVVMQVCLGNPYNTALCNDPAIDYSTQRMERLEACKGNNTLAGCAEAAATTCPANPFQAGICFIDDTTYANGRATQTETCRGTPNGANCGSARALGCVITADVVTNVLFTDTLCSSHMDYDGDRERICLTNKTAPACTLTVTRVCDANNFDPLCDDSPTYQNLRRSTCTDPNDGRCGKTTLRICGADKFDTYCMGATAFIADQLSECADATATTEKCNGVFATALASCLQDPFTPGCDAEPTFTASKVAVRTSRFGYCETDQTNDVRCTGYRTCDNDLVFAPLTSCGADFGPARITFCKVTANAFDAGCVDDLIDAAAQLAYCKLSTANLFGTDCAKDAFTQARIEFCIATPDTDGCRADLRSEMLMSVTDPCAGGVCVDLADLPASILTTPTIKYVQESDGNGGMQDTTTETDDFADGFLKKVTLIAPASGALLNPDGTDNTTIDPAPFNMGGITGVTVREGATTFRRRGGRGSSDADGFVIFNLLKANDDNSVIDSSRASAHAAILPTTNLGAPLTEAPTTAVWRGHYYNFTNIYSTDFYVTFDGTIGAIGFANPAKNAIGTGDNRPDFAKVSGIAMAVTFDAKGVLSGSLSSSFFSDSVLGLIGTEGAVGVVVGSEAGFTATNPDGGATEIVIDPCIGGLAACYGKHAFWVSNTRDSDDTRFLTIKPAGTADKDIDDSSGHFIAGGVNAATLKNFNNPNPANVATLTLSNLEGSNDANSGFSAVRVFDVNSYSYAGLLSDTNVGAPFTDANPPAAEWTAIVQMATSATSAHSPVTLDVAFTGGAGTIKTRTGGIDYGITGNLTIDGKFGANGVIYGDVTINDTNDFLFGDHTLSGLIGVDGAVGVFTGPGFAGGFVARPTPSP